MSAGWTARTTAALAVAVAVLSGCSEEQPANDSLPEPSTAASETAEALPPLGPPDFPVPAEAREKTPDGALEFTRYYIGLMAHVANTSLDSAPLLELSNGCALCGGIADAFAADRAAGLSYSTLNIEFRPSGPGVITGDRAELAFVLSQNAVTVTGPDGQTRLDRVEPATGPLQSGASLVWTEDLRSWIVTSLTIG